MTPFNPLPRSGQLRFRDLRIAFGSRTLVMGILNATPDSFSGDGLAGRVDLAVELAMRMVADGADVLDVGGESTRPGASAVDEAVEIDRVVPVIHALAARVSIPISVDTRRAKVAEAALDAGAHLVNDVTGLQRDPALAEVVAGFNAGLIVTHSPGESWAVRWPAAYDDVVGDVRQFLDRSLHLAVRAGVGLDQIVLDPGFGFGKSLADNLTILRRLGEFRELGQPLLIGTSRKSTIGHILGLPVEDRLEGSLATLPIAIGNGVDIVRVHDVRASVRVAKVADAILRSNLVSSP